MSSTPPTHPPSTPELNPSCPGRLRCVLYAILVMAPWPLIGVVATNSLGMIERNDEIALLFGGITIMPLVAVSIIVPMSEDVLTTLTYVIWALIAVLPPLLLVRWINRRATLVWMLAILSFISLAQAAAGAILLLGKYA